ncbi:MAG: hypothetical protein PHY93_04440 [Bacteriovorax sp.]|nr:hypothetical protein [Bacteriovorax sp.]
MNLLVKNISHSSFFKQTFRSEQGIALIMVMGVIAILTFLLADFTFETKLNKIKIYNQQEKIQARLNAESGLNFALGKLRLYQEGRNKIEKDESLKSAFPSSDLEAVIIQPFIFPPPVSAKANIIQRTAVDEFLKKTMFRGEVSVTFTKVSGFLNPNGLRLQPKTPTDQGAGGPDAAQPNGPGDSSNPGDKTQAQPPAWAVIEKKMIETFQRLLKDKNDSDEDFHLHYANVDANYLVKELRYYVNDKGAFQDSMLPEIEAKFNQKNITPKFGPMSSIDELYLLPSWDDAIVDLIKDRMSVHEVSVIAINELTIEDLKILFPAINNIQIEEFFKYRDGDVDKKIKGKKFKDAEDFKRVVVSELNIVSDSEYQERITALKNAGLVIDTAGKLYKVNSRGSMNNAIYNLVAYIDLPIKPQPKKPSPKGQTPPADGNPPDDQDTTGAEKTSPSAGQTAKAAPIELLLPRVVEIRLE